MFISVIVCIFGTLLSTSLSLLTYFNLVSCSNNGYNDTTNLLGESIHSAMTMNSKWEFFADLLANVGDVQESFEENSNIFAESYNSHIFYVDYVADQWSVVYSYPDPDASVVGTDLSVYEDFTSVLSIMQLSGDSQLITFPRTTSIQDEPDLLHCTPVKVNGSVVAFVVVGIDIAGLLSVHTPLLSFIDDFDTAVELNNFNGRVTIYTSNRNGFDSSFRYEANLFYNVDLIVLFSNPGVQNGWLVYLIAAMGLSTTFGATYLIYVYTQKKHVSEMKTQFLARMTHEIRTPMNGVIGMSEILAQEEEISETAVECVRIINACSKQLLHLVNNFLDLSKIESKKLEVHANHFETSLFQTIAHDTWLIGQRNNGTTFKVVHENVPMDANVLGDKLKIQQVISNLVTNAIKFTNQGSITVNVAWEDRNSPTSPGSILVRVSVIDTGIGIPENCMDELFKPYTQMSNNNLGQGTGIGLTISRSLAVAMGGSLTCTSKEDVGSEFMFKFIVVGEFYQAHRAEATSTSRTKFAFRSSERSFEMSSERSAQRSAERSAERFAERSGLSTLALIVDDNNINTQLLQRILEKLEVQCQVTHSGKEALYMCKSTVYDVIFMDKFMPGQDGILTTRAIRRESLNVDSVILFCTADVSAGSREECMLAGGTDCIAKPITFETVSNCMLKHDV